jgi:predicted acyltransferase
MSTSLAPEDLSKRLASLDFMRGLIMVLLALEAAGLYNILYDSTEHNALGIFFEQFHHHPWNGLRFWDLIQPGFMFIAGTAMAYSITKMKEKGVPPSTRTSKILKRCGWLFFWGVLSYAVRKTGLSFELWNVLTQLSFTILVAYLIFDWSSRNQILFSVGLLLLTEALYRFTNVPDFNQPFTDQHNFGNYMDLLLMGKINKGGWVAINCIPTAVHTIAGAVVGKLLMGNSESKTKQLIYWGIATLVLGYSLDFAGITPIIKRIATTSFTLASLGWCLLGLAACYYFIDIKGRQKGLFFFNVVGMNSIFIYLFFEIVGDRWFNGYVGAITNGIMGMIQTPDLLKSIITCIVIFMLEWGICLFLYRKKIFFRL